METFSQELITLFESNLSELLDDSVHFTPPLDYYKKIKLAYLKGDVESLYKLKFDLVSMVDLDSPHYPFISFLSSIRLQLREEKVDSAALNITRLENHEHYKIWGGEINFVLGLAWERLGQDYKALNSHETSNKLYTELGAMKCANKALHNVISARSRINPERQYIPDFYFIKSKALELGDNITAGKSLLNIAKEYESMEAYLAALKYAEEGISLLDRERGSMDYYLAIAQRCNLLYNLNRKDEAKMDYEVAKAAPFSQVKAALDVMSDYFQTETNSEFFPDLLNASWKERLCLKYSGGKTNRLTVLEEKVIVLLAKGPKDKFELIDHLYGNAASFSVLENRFKNLLNRVRKKFKGLIYYQGGFYHMAEDVFKLSAQTVDKSIFEAQTGQTL